MKHIYVNLDRTIEEQTERKKMVELLKQKIRNEPKKYHYIKNDSVYSTDKLRVVR